MGQLPTLKPREVAALLESLGFVDVAPTLLRKIAKDIGLTVEGFLGRA